MLIDLIGKLYRRLPNFHGKGYLAHKTLGILLRGKGYKVIVKLENANSARLLCNLDDWIPWNVYLFGRYQTEEAYERFLLNVVENCDLVFDVGANIGYYSIQFGAILKARGRGRVHSFEPMTYQCEVLEFNKKLNNLGNVVIHKNIVSSSAGDFKKIFFYGITNTGRSSLWMETDQFELVETITLDKICETHRTSEVLAVKIDVEGHEFSVLLGMRGLLSHGRVTHLFIEINSYNLSLAGVCPSQIVEFLGNYGYKAYSIARGRPEVYRGLDESLVYFTKKEITGRQ